MELRHLKAFVAVAEEGTFSKAAQRLDIAQPPLTRHVQQLEREVGSVLFDRGRNGAVLTRHGRALLDRALPVLNSFRDIQEFRRVPRVKSRGIHIAIGCGLWDALERIRSLHATLSPGVRITARDLCRAHSCADERMPDLTIARSRSEASVFECEELFEERFVALISDRHRLASREFVSLSDLAAEPLLLFERHVEPGIWDRTVQMIRTASTRPRIVDGQPFPCTLAARVLIAAGEGYYLGTASPYTQTHRASGVAAVPLREPHTRLKVHLAWRAGATQDVKDFVRSARSAFGGAQRAGLEAD